MKRRVKKQFWLSPQDARELKRKAKLCGITETAVIRILLHGYEPKEKPDARFYEAMRQLSAIGNNINQLALKANALDFVDTPMLKNRSGTLASVSGGHRSGVPPPGAKQFEMAVRRERQ